jgi:hypothetical protein
MKLYQLIIKEQWNCKVIFNIHQGQGKIRLNYKSPVQQKKALLGKGAYVKSLCYKELLDGKGVAIIFCTRYQSTQLL